MHKNISIKLPTNATNIKSLLTREASKSNWSQRISNRSLLVARCCCWWSERVSENVKREKKRETSTMLTARTCLRMTSKLFRVKKFFLRIFQWKFLGKFEWKICNESWNEEISCNGFNRSMDSYWRRFSTPHLASLYITRLIDWLIVSFAKLIFFCLHVRRFFFFFFLVTSWVISLRSLHHNCFA